MATREARAEAFIVYYDCDDCGRGTLKNRKLVMTDADGKVLENAKYLHVCTHCGIEKHMDEPYPQTIFKPVMSSNK